LARAPVASSAALDVLATKGAAPTTRAAAAVALGLVGDASADAALLRAMAEDAHPTVRGYAALALGMVGTEASAAPLRAFFEQAKSPDAIGWSGIGLALFGRRQDTEAIRRRLMAGTNNVIGWNLVHALRMTADRSGLDALLDIAADERSGVQELGILAVGYVVAPEPFPMRIRMSRGYDYTIRNLTLDAYYFTL
jgi:HEAT repeat protein